MNKKLLLALLSVCAAQPIAAQRVVPTEAVIDSRTNLPATKFVSHPKNSSTFGTINGYTKIDELVNAFSFYSNEQQPIAYQEENNLTALIIRGAQNAGQGGTLKDDLNNIFIRQSTDRGTTWSAKARALHSDSEGGGRYPSIAISEGSSLEETIFLYTISLTEGTGWTKTVIGYNDALDQVNTSQLFTQPNVDGTTYSWRPASKTLFRNGNAIALGSLGEVASGIGGPNNLFVMRDKDLTGEFSFAVPSQISNDVFATATGTGFTSSVVNIDTKEDGTLVACVFGRLLDSDDPERPFPAFTESTNDGATWSSLTIMPQSVLLDYASSVGALPDSSFIPFSSNDFAVMADGSYSFVSEFLESNAPKGDDQVRHLVEVNYKDGSWSVRKIADVSGLVFQFIADEQGARSASQTRTEVQIAQTPDRSRVIVKWMDLVGYTIGGTDVNSSDVFVSGREAGSTSWTSPSNITNDPMLNRCTWIPRTIPSDLESIPMITVQTLPTSSSEMTTLVDDQFVLVPQLSGPLHRQGVFMSNFSVADIVSVEEQQEGPAARSLSVAPSPASDYSDLHFALDRASDVTVELVSLYGQSMGIVYRGSLGEGNHTVRLDRLSRFGSGAYTVRLATAYGSVSTKLVIVR